MNFRRWGTWIVAAALAALGLAAAVDAVRGDEALPDQAVPPTTTTVSGLGGPIEAAADRLREAGVRGVLTYADEDCRLHAVSLPELEPARAPSFEMCRPATPSEGVGTVGGEVVWAGLGYGAVQVVISADALRGGILGNLDAGMVPADSGFRAVQAASLGDQRYVVLADSTHAPRERFLVLFDGDRAIFVQPRWVVRDARVIRPSPRGRYFALLGGEGDGVRLFDRDANTLALPASARDPHAVAWSPDDRWTALATREAVYVFPAEGPSEPIVRIPLAVQDLDWGA